MTDDRKTSTTGNIPLNPIPEWETENRYWRDNYLTRPYGYGESYDTYEPAYRYGVESYWRYQGQPYVEVESDLERGWNNFKDKVSLKWEQAKNAVRDAYDRLVDRNAANDNLRRSAYEKKTLQS